MHINRFSLSVIVLALASGCRSGGRSASDSLEDKSAGAEAPAAAPEPEEQKAAVNTAEGIAAITKEIPLYPSSKSKIPTTWGAPAQFEEGKYGSTYEADTADPKEKVLDYYEKEMASRGWKGQRMFQGMIAFEKPSAPGKLITLVSGPDDQAPGQTLLRVLVVDK
ncbi:MAG: hypothetical protein ABI895_35080 [Deltaproteobacteria bacterium]